MNRQRNLGLVAAAATLLAAAPLSVIFQRWTWYVESILAVAVVAGAVALLRLARTPLWGQLLTMLGALLFALTWLFPSGGEVLKIVPTPTTLAHFAELLRDSVRDMNTYGVEVPDTPALLFVTVLGVAGVAVLVDLLTVGLGRPALAGLPMLAIYSVPVAVYIDSVSPISFVVGAVGYLWLLVADNVERVRRFGRRFTSDGRDVDIWESSPLAAAGRRLAVVGVAVAVLLPLTLPGLTGGMLDRLGGGGNGPGRGAGGQAGSVDLFAALRGQLNQSAVTDLVTVSTDEPSPFYLRFGVADDLDSDGFKARTPTGQAANRSLPDPRDRPQSGVTHNRYRATVEVSRNLNMRLLPLYPDPVSLRNLDGSWLYDPNLQVVFSKRATSRGKRYSFDYVRSTYSVAALQAAPPLVADDTVLAQQTSHPDVVEVSALVNRLIKGKRTDYERVRAIYDHFSRANGFSYRVSTEESTGGQAIVDFLTTKTGFCQQYAAAMAWMVRAAGIPARVAFGFTNGSNRRGDTYTLTNRNLHAWTEVYFSGIGWVPFDATPTAGVPGSARSDWAPDTDAPVTAPAPSNSTAPGTVDSSAGPSRPDAADRDPEQDLAAPGGTVRTGTPVWPWWVAGIVLVLALLAAPALRRGALRRRRERPAPPRAPEGTTVEVGGAFRGDRPTGQRERMAAHAAWDELLDTLVDYRIAVDLTETPRATAERLARSDLDSASAVDAVRLLGRAEERARYAPTPLSAGELPVAVRTVRQAVATGAERRTRIMAVVLPPSVLLRWRTAVNERVARLVATTARIRANVGRWSPRRWVASRTAR